MRVRPKSRDAGPRAGNARARALRRKPHQPPPRRRPAFALVIRSGHSHPASSSRLKQARPCSRRHLRRGTPPPNRRSRARDARSSLANVALYRGRCRETPVLDDADDRKPPGERNRGLDRASRQAASNAGLNAHGEPAFPRATAKREAPQTAPEAPLSGRIPSHVGN